jgi:ribosome recycling factor
VEFNNKRLPLKELGQISMPNAQTIIVNLSSQPQAMASVVKAIQETDRGLNPLVEGSVVRIPIPKISKEVREKLVKVAKAHSEKTKISIRKVLQKGVSEARKMKGQVSEDDIRLTEKQIQELTNQHIKTVDTILQAKTKELLGS